MGVCAGARHSPTGLRACRAASQVHGGRVLVAPPEWGGDHAFGPDEAEWPSPRIAGEGDAVISEPGGPALAIEIADCAAVLMADPVRGTTAAVHAGWRGTALELVAKTVKRLRDEFRCNPAHMRAWLSPSIGPCCYEVGPEVVEALAPTAGGKPDWMIEDERGWRVDLAAANRQQLEAAGVPAENVRSVDLCTSCRPDLFFSHRRDRGRTGRMWAIVVHRPSLIGSRLLTADC